MNSVLVVSFFLVVVFGSLMLYELIPSRTTSRIDLHQDAMEPEYNDVGSLSRAYDEDCEICIKREPGKFHFVTSFFPVTNAAFGKSLDENFIEEPMDEEEKFIFMKKRVQELMDTLQKNLNHELITAVHVLYNHPSAAATIVQNKLKNMQKLIFHPLKCVSKKLTYRKVFEYIQTYLLNTPLIIANQDIYIGKGFGDIDFEVLRNKKIAYALTRAGKRERYCEMVPTCRRGVEYLGSHDSFVFILPRKLTKTELKEFDFKLDNFGAENIIINFFKRKLGFTVLNPCFRLETFHVHCIQFHNKDRPRINYRGNTGWIPFTDLLE